MPPMLYRTLAVLAILLTTPHLARCQSFAEIEAAVARIEAKVTGGTGAVPTRAVTTGRLSTDEQAAQRILSRLNTIAARLGYGSYVSSRPGATGESTDSSRRINRIDDVAAAIERGVYHRNPGFVPTNETGNRPRVTVLMERLQKIERMIPANLAPNAKR